MVTPLSRGKSFEYRVLYILKEYFPDAKRVPVSGSASGFKGDIITDKFVIECKKTMHESIRIKKEWLKSIEKIAREQGKHPLLVFSLRNTEPYAVLPLREFLRMCRKVKASR